MAVERSSSLFDPHFPTYVKSVIVCGVLLVVMLLVGAKFEFAKRMGWIKFRRKGVFVTSFYVIKYNWQPLYTRSFERLLNLTRY